MKFVKGVVPGDNLLCQKNYGDFGIDINSLISRLSLSIITVKVIGIGYLFAKVLYYNLQYLLYLLFSKLYKCLQNIFNF